MPIGMGMSIKDVEVSRDAARRTTTLRAGRPCGGLRGRSEGAAMWLAQGQVWSVVTGGAPDEGVFASDPNSPRAARATEAMLRMKKIDLAELRRAAAGR